MPKLPRKVHNYVSLLDKNIELITSLKNELQKTIVEDVMMKKNYYALTDLELIETINLLIENTEAMKLLVKEGLAFQALSIPRNSTEILLRIILQVVHYQSVEFEPPKRQGFDLSNKAEIIKYLQARDGKSGLENEAFNFVKQMFPDQNNPFFNTVNQLQKVYGVLCSFSHPENQLRSRISKSLKSCEEKEDQVKFSAYLIGGERVKLYDHDINNFIYIFECNTLAVRLIIELFRNVISDENHIKNIQNVHKTFFDFHEFFREITKISN